MNVVSPPVWHMITGEYPPAPGGVSDYTALVAEGLVTRDSEVHVWCPQLPGPAQEPDGLVVHQLSRGFQLPGIAELNRKLQAFSSPRTLLVQYVYNAFGCYGMNLPFCAWLLWRRYWHGDDVRVMFHEPYYQFGWQRLRRNVLALMTHVMAALVMLAGRTIYISIPAWERLLKPWNWARRPMIWLPIPATIPGGPPPEKPLDRRRPIVGHFGTYGEQMRGRLLALFTLLLTRCPEIELHLLGGGSKRFATDLLTRLPERASQVVAFDRLPDDDVAAEIRACDLMLQYYPDGVSSRRTSVMACLANGVPVVTTHGQLTEPVWNDSQAVAMAPAEDLDAVVGTVVSVLDAPDSLTSLSVGVADLYESQFALERSLDIVTPPTAVPVG